jgi:hypothetical protein
VQGHVFVVQVDRFVVRESALIRVRARDAEEANVRARRVAEDHPDHWEWHAVDQPADPQYRAHGAELGRDV